MVVSPEPPVAASRETSRILAILTDSSAALRGVAMAGTISWFTAVRVVTANVAVSR